MSTVTEPPTDSISYPRSGPSSPDSNLLRVHSAMIGRRLSDNELLNPPKIRVGSYSCGSSASDLRVGVLPIRRHSSTGPNERRQSVFSVSPPTVSTTARRLPTPRGGIHSATQRDIPRWELMLPGTSFLHRVWV